MAADRKAKCRRRMDSGQSLVEFIFMLPFIITMIVYMTQLNGAINMSINYQQFVRSHLFHLMFNSRNYPEIQYSNNFHGNRLYLGVNKDVITEGSELTPKTPRVKVGSKTPSGDETVDIYPSVTKRQHIQVRVIMGICTPNNIVGTQYLTGSGMSEVGGKTYNPADYFCAQGAGGGG